MGCIDDLSDETMTEILSRFPVKSVARFRCVCRSWNTLLTNPDFIRSHSMNSMPRTLKLFFQPEEKTYDFITISADFVDGDEFRNLYINLVHPCSVIGSCNGLICLISLNYRFMWFLNPTTRDARGIQSLVPISRIEDLSSGLNAGFGSVVGTEDYKVVLISSSDFIEDEAAVFTTRTNSWSRVDVQFPLCLFSRKTGVRVGGCVHWLPVNGTNIVSFNFTDDSFGQIPLPNFDLLHNEYADLSQDFDLCSLDGCLCIVCMFDNELLDVWSMKNYGYSDSWIREFSIQEDLICSLIIHPLVIRNNGEILLLMGGNTLHVYDKVADTAEGYDISGVSEQLLACTYFEDLMLIP